VENGAGSSRISNVEGTSNRILQKPPGISTRPKGNDKGNIKVPVSMSEIANSLKGNEPSSLEGVRIRGQDSRDSLNTKRSIVRKNSSDIEHSGKAHTSRISEVSIEVPDRRALVCILS
jgi:hypothetical protein